MNRRVLTATFLLNVTLTAAVGKLNAQQPGVVSYGPPSAEQPSAPFWASPQGFGFRPLRDVYLTALGYFVPSSMPYDPTASGVGEYLYIADDAGAMRYLARSVDPHPVSVPVDARSGVLGSFVYALLTERVRLDSGQLYVVTHFGPMQVNISSPGVVLANDFLLDGGFTITPGGGTYTLVERIDEPEQTGVGFLYVTATPEPGSFLLLLTGIGVLLCPVALAPIAALMARLRIPSAIRRAETATSDACLPT
jgi:hypothetical protein